VDRSPSLTATQKAYDTVASEYARVLRDELAEKPIDRAILAAFAELVGGQEENAVGDLGCGPGRVTAHLHDLGIAAFGIDLSPMMIEQARIDYPDLRFEVGSLTALDLPDQSLAGALAWYSLIHTPLHGLPAVAAEIARVLRPGGYLLTAFQVGDDPVHLDRAYGHAIELTAYRRQPEQMVVVLEGAGLEITARVVRAPERGERVPQAYLLARKPSQPEAAA
jgi:SAM-dependent methyltransferase